MPTSGFLVLVMAIVAMGSVDLCLGGLHDFLQLFLTKSLLFCLFYLRGMTRLQEAGILSNGIDAVFADKLQLIIATKRREDH